MRNRTQAEVAEPPRVPASVHGFGSLPAVTFLVLVMVTAFPKQCRCQEGLLGDVMPNVTDVSDSHALRVLKAVALQGHPALQSWDFALDPCGYEECQVWEPTAAAPHRLGYNQDAVPPLCHFGGVACQGWRVSGLSLSGNDLKLIPVSQQLGQLASLRMLDLSHAGIVGRLSPRLLESLSHLEVLNLSNNNLTGTLPPELSTLTSLKTLNLSNNSLQGSIPLSLAPPGLANLEFLDLSNNSLSGRLPGGFADMRALETLDVSGNCGICGGPPAPAPGMTLDAILEVFNYTGTHLWMPCEALNEMRRCPTHEEEQNFEDDERHNGILTTTLQVVIGFSSLLIGSLLTALMTCYLQTSGIGVRCLCCWQPPREPNAVRDEAELTAAALEAAERASSQAGLSPSGPPSLHPSLSLKPSRSIGAIIINPGSTIQQPNICVAIMELGDRQEALQRSASVFVPSRVPRPQLQPSSQAPGSNAIELGRVQNLPERGTSSNSAPPTLHRAASAPIPLLGSSAGATSQPLERQLTPIVVEQAQESPGQSMWRWISMRWQEHFRGGDAAEGQGTPERARSSANGAHPQMMMFI